MTPPKEQVKQRERKTPLATAKSSCPDTSDFVGAYRLAEHACNRVEAFRDQVGLTSMELLRQAGSTFIESVKLEDEARKSELLALAVSMCQRASFEANEAGILNALSRIEKFRIDYQSVVISDVFPEWNAILRTANDATETLLKCRAGNFVNSRIASHEHYFKYFEELSEYSIRLTFARDELNKKIIEEQKVYRKWLLGTLLAAAALVVAIGQLFIDSP